MAEEQNSNIFDRLHNGEKVECPKCKKGVLEPFNALYPNSHDFNCSNCDFHYHWDPVINIE